MHPSDRLAAAIATSRSIACVGLDPRPALIPPALAADSLSRHGDTAEAVAEAFLTFNRGIIHAITGHCAAVKPQVACYEAYGPAGMSCLAETIRFARERGIEVIVDGKRNDIGSTAEHYAQAWLGRAPGLGGAALPGWGGDWLTVNGYLGADGIVPFTGPAPTTTGIFVLVKTSNPSSGDLQDQPLADGSPVMEAMARLVQRWGHGRQGACGLTDIGAVVGATWPAQARRLRTLMPDNLFLVPGYGAQGGSAADAKAGARPDGTGILINSSRGILGAWKEKAYAGMPWTDAARAALEAMNKDLACQ